MNKVINRKALLVGFSLLFVVVLIAITSFVNAGLDPSYWASDEFKTDMLLTVALVMIGTLTGFSEGDNFYRTKQDGLYVVNYNKFYTERQKIENNLDKFGDWVLRLYRKEAYNKIKRYLINENGIKQAELILKLDRTQIEQLTEPKAFEIEGEIRYFNSLTQEQIKAILKVFNGEIRVKYVHESYYLNAYSKNSSKSMYELASEQEKKKRQKLITLMAFRVITTILIGMVLAGLTRDLVEGDKAQAWIKMLSRYFTLFSAVSWGVFISNDMIKDECLFLDYKIRTLEQFYLDVEVNKTFTTKTEEEKAFEKINELLKVGDKVE